MLKHIKIIVIVSHYEYETSTSQKCKASVPNSFIDRVGGIEPKMNISVNDKASVLTPESARVYHIKLSFNLLTSLLSFLTFTDNGSNFYEKMQNESVTLLSFINDV